MLPVFKVVALAVFLTFGLEPKDAKAAIAVDSVSTGPLSNAVTSPTFSHTVGASGTNRLPVVVLSIRHDASNYTVSVTYAGMPMSRSGSIRRKEALSEIWYLRVPTHRL
jgi:hypothetical protein